jgi:uncharacterized protein (DUF58 family)
LNPLYPEHFNDIHPLVLRARKVVEGLLAGDHASPFRGGSIEFAQHRAYSPGDDLRSIDWKLVGRTDHIYIKQFEATTNLRAFFLLDTSGSMNYPSAPYPLQEQGLGKMTFARLLLACLGYLCLRQGDAVSLYASQEGRAVILPPRSRPGYLNTFCDVLDGLQPTGTEGLMGPLAMLQQRLSQRSLLVLASDFFSDLPPLFSQMKALAAHGHDLVALQILHRDEQTFPFHRSYRFEGLEGESSMMVHGDEWRQGYLERFEAHQKALKKGLFAAGVDVHVCFSDESAVKVLTRLLNSPLRRNARQKQALG